MALGGGFLVCVCVFGFDFVGVLSLLVVYCLFLFFFWPLIFFCVSALYMALSSQRTRDLVGVCFLWDFGLVFSGMAGVSFVASGGVVIMS